MARFVVVGLGGIGNKLLPDLCEQLNYHAEGEHSLVLVDGDKYEDKNRSRQRFGSSLLARFIEELRGEISQFSEFLKEVLKKPQ